MRERECGAILFDMDGVLVDSEACVRRHWRWWCGRSGVDFERLMAMAHGRRAVDTIRVVAPGLNAEEEAERFTDAETKDPSGTELIEGARELVTALPGGAWAVVTSGAKRAAESRLRYVGLPLPRVLVTAEDVRQGKPDPEGYLLAARRLGVAASDCVVVEDAPSGIKAAKAGGMFAVGVCSTHAAGELSAADVVIGDLRGLGCKCGSGDGRLRLRMAE
ncbi:MAG: HAD family hydrolase [Phycisphaeraceae bacterium]|nr:HAD family hydrolase [Phycisphaeraceae bacterium]